RLLLQQHCDVLGADVASHSLRLWHRAQSLGVVDGLQMPAHRLAGFRGVGGIGPDRIVDVQAPPLCWRKPAMCRLASSAERPHMPIPPSPPALLTAAASAGVVMIPIGAWMMGNLSFSLSLRGFDGHMLSSRLISNHDPLNFIQSDLIAPAVVELRSAR